MMRYVRISTFSRSAEARALESGRTWKPMMIAFEALASSTSESVMAPTPRCTTSTLTSGVARLRHAFEAQHLHRRGRTRARHGLPALVVHRPHPAIELPADEVVPTAQRAVLDEDRGERTLAGVERRLEHGALRAPLGVGLEIE